MSTVSPPPPHTFQRRILLATVGLNPQVVTETLYALSIGQSPAFLPTEIHIVTTLEGRSRSLLTLLDPSVAMLSRFAAEFDLPQLANALRPERVHVIADTEGRGLDDIVTEADSAAAADTINEIVRNLTLDETAALHVSIAGGRKTMASCSARRSRCTAGRRTD